MGQESRTAPPIVRKGRAYRSKPGERRILIYSLEPLYGPVFAEPESRKSVDRPGGPA
jgi:hypothetical protein